MKFSELLDMAIKSEENTYKFYNVFNIDKYPNMEQALEMLAKEELEHKKILENVTVKKHVDLKLSDLYPLDYKINKDSKLQNVFKVAMAMKNEYSFYKDLMYNSGKENIKNTLKSIASQELSYRARPENIYDELFYKEF